MADRLAAAWADLFRGATWKGSRVEDLRARKAEVEDAIREQSAADIAWLASRIGWPPAPHTGISSNALVVAAVMGTEPARYPLDESDYTRCVYACTTAPEHRKQRAYEILAQFREALDGTKEEGIDG